MLEFPRWKILFILAICIAAFYMALPNFLSKDMRESLGSALPERTINLGLDLKGGSHLLMEVDFNVYFTDQLQILKDNVRSRLREEKIGYKNLSLKSDSDGKYIYFTLRDKGEIEKTTAALNDLFRDVDVEVSDDAKAILRYRDKIVDKMKKDVVAQSIEVVRRRVDETGTKEPVIQRQGELRILLQVPGLQDPERLKALLGKTAKMSFHLMDSDYPGAMQAKLRGKPNVRVLPNYDKDKKLFYHVKKRVEIGGENLAHASAGFDQTGKPAIMFRFNTQGAKKFAKITRENVNKPFAIVLDNKVLTAPNINEPITGGSGQITGQFGIQEAKDLSLLLRSGALPAPLRILEERTVGPSLGQDSIDAGKTAAIVGVVLVIVLMFAFYGLFGLFSNIALIINMVLVLALLSFFGATLTLPGIAGLVLTMGIAVDANVLIFERIREEMRVGKTPFAATDNGFRQAFKTIIDSNITTLIATFLLFIYGTGPVKGFAVTLSIGIICSMFSAVLLTRMMVVLWLKKNKPNKLPL